MGLMQVMPGTYRELQARYGLAEQAGAPLFLFVGRLIEKKGPRELVAAFARLHERGLKVCVWINPYIAQRSHLFREGMETIFVVPLREQARATERAIDDTRKALQSFWQL